MTDLIIIENDKVIIGFINSSNALEFTTYTSIDGGVLTLDTDKEYSKEELLELLKNEIENP